MTYPDITRPDAGTVLVTESAAYDRSPDTPKGLVSFSTFLSTDGETVLTYTHSGSTAMTAIFPLYDTYAAKTDRDLPLVIVGRS